MTIVSSVLRLCRSLSVRLSRIATAIMTEYAHATRAVSHLDYLKGRDLAELRRQRIVPGGIPRAVFDAVYGNARDPADGRANPRSHTDAEEHGAASPLSKPGWIASPYRLIPDLPGGASAVRKTALWSALCVASAIPALSADSTPYAMGGITREFLPKVRAADRSGELFRITGHCQSACTMFLAVRNVCIEPNARLLFHAARTPRGTRDMMNAYNSRLRAYLVANRIMESPAFHTIPGRDMIVRFGYRRCP